MCLTYVIRSNARRLAYQKASVCKAFYAGVKLAFSKCLRISADRSRAALAAPGPEGADLVLPAGQDLQDAVNRCPNGGTLRILRGLFARAAIVKDIQIFCEPGVVIDDLVVGPRPPSSEEDKVLSEDMRLILAHNGPVRQDLASAFSWSRIVLAGGELKRLVVNCGGHLLAHGTALGEFSCLGGRVNLCGASSQHGFCVNTAFDIEVDRCRFGGPTTDDGCAIKVGGELRLTSNLFQGISLGLGVVVKSALDGLIQNNDVIGLDRGLGLRLSVVTPPGGRLLVQGNRINRVYGPCITVLEGSPKSPRIVDNVLSFCKDACIAVERGSSCLIGDNVFFPNGMGVLVLNNSKPVFE